MSKTAALKLKYKLGQEIEIIDTMNVLKQIAISEFHFMEAERQEARRFTESLATFFGYFRKKRLTKSPLLDRTGRGSAVVAVTSDEGFSGALNSQIIEKAMQLSDEEARSRVLVVGRRGARKLADAGVRVEREFPGIDLPLGYEAVLPLKNQLIELCLGGEIGSARVVYARCLSFTRQELAVEELLPFNLEAVGAVEDLPPPDVILEPDLEAIFEYAIGLWFGRKLYEVYWDSKLSEVASRAIELNERYEDLSQASGRTRVRYFRASHEVIDSGIREVFASQHFAKKLKERKGGPRS